MKKTVILILVAACLLLGMTSPATAREGLYAGIGVPYNTIDGDFDGSSVVHSTPSANWIAYLPEVNGAFGINVWAGYELDKHWAFEFDVMRSNHTWRWESQSGKAHYYTFSLNGKYTLTESQTTRPYVLFGFSYNSLEIKNGSIDLDTGQVDEAKFSGPGITVGTGLDQYLTQHLCATLRLMYRFVDYTNADANNIDGGGYRRDLSTKGSGFMFMLGSAYHF